MVRQDWFSKDVRFPCASWESQTHGKPKWFHHNLASFSIIFHSVSIIFIHILVYSCVFHNIQDMQKTWFSADDTWYVLSCFAAPPRVLVDDQRANFQHHSCTTFAKRVSRNIQSKCHVYRVNVQFDSRTYTKKLNE